MPHMVVSERSRRGRTPLAVGALLSVFAACFNPQGSDTVGGTDATDGSTTASTSVTTGLTSASTGGVTTSPSTATSDPASTTTATSGSTTEGMCTGPEDCPDDAKICVGGQCVQCSASDDCGDPALPVCDPQSFTCRKCQFHDECELACDIEVGQCFPPETLELLVTPKDNCLECDEEKPCCSITKAVEYASSRQDVSHVRVRLSSATPEAVSANLKFDLSNKVLAIVADGPSAKVQPVVGAPIDVDQKAIAGVRIYLWKLTLVGNVGGPGVSCRNTALWLDDVRISGSSVAGLSTDACAVKLRNSYVLGSTNNISTVGGAVELHNVLVGLAPFGSEIVIGEGTAFTARYSTIVDEEGGSKNLVECKAAADADFGNSILVSKGVNAESIAGCEEVLKVANSVVSAHFSWTEGGDNAIASLEELAFGDSYLLTGDSKVAEGVAVWSAIDLPRDINGDARPNLEGTQDWAGADIPN